MSEQEKNSIREQHSGGMKVMTENFGKLINSKLGDSKPLLKEEDMEIHHQFFQKFRKRRCNPYLEALQNLLNKGIRRLFFLL